MVSGIDPEKNLAELLVMPLQADAGDLMDARFFDPWRLITPFVGTYDKAFDDCAIDTLKDISLVMRTRTDLASDMFREALCRAGYCEYGSSPRLCFPKPFFGERIEELISKWQQYSMVMWHT